MNSLTKKIAEWLKIDLDTAWRVQEEMMCMNISFGSSSARQLKVAAQEAFKSIVQHGDQNANH